jgi:hypothetical protein
MNPVADSPNLDVRGSWPALLRAAKRARAISKSTGTPFYIMRNGKIVDLNKSPKRRPKTAKPRRRS